MKRWLILLVLLFLPLSAGAHTYYFDSVNGNDNKGSPDNTSRPYRTITKLNTLLGRTITAGDIVAFKRGTSVGQQHWGSTGTPEFGSIHLQNSTGTSGSPITFTAYGNGYAPLISSTKVLTNKTATGWTQAGSTAIFSYALGYQSGLTEDGLPLWPVTGLWLYLGNIGATVTVNATAKTFTRSDSGNWITDGVAVGSFIIFDYFGNAGNNGIFRVSAVTASTITCSTATTLANETNGNFIEYAPESLFLAGSYYEDDSNRVMYYWSSDGAGPANHVLEISYLGVLYLGSNNNYITIDGLSFDRGGPSLMLGAGANFNATGYTIQNCTFKYGGVSFVNGGTARYYFSDVLIQNNTFDYCWGGTIRCEDLDNGYCCFVNLQILNNTITHNNVFPGVINNGQPWVKTGDNDPIVLQSLSQSTISGNIVNGGYLVPAFNCSGIHYYIGASLGGEAINSAQNDGSGHIEIVIAANKDQMITGDRVTVYNTSPSTPSAEGIRTITEGADNLHWILNGSTWGGSTFTGTCVRSCPFSLSGNVISKNLVINQSNPGYIAGIWEHDSSTNMPTDWNLSITDNLVVNCVGTGIFCTMGQSASNPSMIENNTVYCTGNGNLGLYLLGYAANWVIKNNIIYVPGSGAVAVLMDVSTVNSSKIVMDYNDLYAPNGEVGAYNTGYTTLASWQAGMSLDQHSISANPGFLNGSGNYSQATDFQFLNTSPCYKTGVNVGLTKDFFGNQVGSIPDIGAYNLSRQAGVQVNAKMY